LSPDASKRPQGPHRQVPSAESHAGWSFRSFLPIFVLLAVIYGVYAPSLQYHFILDDHRFTGDPRVQSPGHLWEYFTNYVWAQFTGGPPSFYRPLFVVWMRANFILCQMSPWGWHLLSILKHAVVALLLYLLVWKLLRDRGAALLAAALFALHPLHTECVAWVTVPDPLMAIGILATLLLYLRFAEEFVAAQNKRAKKKAAKDRGAKLLPQRALPWLVASAVACFLTLLTKETAIILPVVLFVLTLLMLRREVPAVAENSGETNVSLQFAAALRLNAGFAAAAVAYLLLRFNAFSGKLGSLTQHLPWRSVVLSWPGILWFYVQVLLWPVRSYAYADPTLLAEFSVSGVLLPGLEVGCVIAGLAAALFCLWRKAHRELPAASVAGIEHALLIGVLLLVCPTLLALNLNVLNPGDFLHGRYAYLSSLGLMLIVAAAWHLAGKGRGPLLWAAGLIAVVFAGLTVIQEKQWRDDLTLFTAGHHMAPNNPWVALNLERANVQAALPLVEQGRCSEALPVFERVTREYPQEWSAWAALGYCYFTANNLRQAEESLHKAAELSRDPRTIEMWQELRAHMGLSSPAPLD
jgi:tetratricopeptide (TPR) repeat protein